MADNLLSPGDILNNTYRIESLVGEGGTGEVYRALNTAAERIVAIKILKSQFSRDPVFIRLLRRELNSVANVSHDAVVRYIDLLRTEEHGGLYFLAMDYVEGPSLADLMEDGPVDRGVLMRIARQLGGGLAACHASNIFHRDLSPDNILLRGGSPDRATLIDFGIAKDVNPEAKTVVGGGFAGKYEYAAPEQLDGKADARTDLYSLGATLAAAARGEAPSMPPSLMEIIRKKHAPVDVSDIPAPLGDLVARLLPPEPEDRLQSAEAMLAHIAGSGDAGGAASAAASAAAVAPAREPAKAGGGIEDLLAPEEDERDGPGRPMPRTVPPKPARKKRGLLVPLLGLGALAAVAALVTVGPGRELVFGPDLPLAEPFAMTISYRDGAAEAVGNASDEEKAAALAEMLRARLPVGERTELSAARGAPDENWNAVIAALADALAKLDEGELSVEDRAATLGGLAATPDVAEAIGEAVAGLEAGFDYDVALALTVAPQPFPAALAEEAIRYFADCGPLTGNIAPPGEYAPGATIVLEGAISEDAALERLRERLTEAADDVTIDAAGVKVINPSVCRVRDLLPPTDPDDLRIVYRSSQSGETVEGDAFAPEDYAVIDLEVPATREGYLYVFIVDNEFNAYHLRPAQLRPEQRLFELGEIEGDTRRIPVTWSKEEGSREKPALGFAEPYGATLVFAVVSDERLFPHMRAGAEDTRELAPDLAAAIAELEAGGGRIDQAQRFLLVDVPE